MSLFLGIDFGTSTNVVTCWKSDKKIAEPVPLEKYGSPNIFPNVIYYESVSNKIVGNVAVDCGITDPDNAVFAIKRRLESPNFQQYILALGRNVGSEEVTADIYCGLKYVDKVLDCDIAVGVSQTVGLKWRGRFLETLPRNTLYGKSSDF